MKKYLRIILPIILIIIASLYFYSSIFSAWVAGGPPNEYPKAWAYNSFRFLFYGIGFFVFAITAFLTLKAEAKRIKIKCIFGLLIGVTLFSIPHISKFMEIDACLDQGGRWNEKYHSCEH